MARKPKKQKTPLQKWWRRQEVKLQQSRLVTKMTHGLYVGYMSLVARTTRWTLIGVERYGATGERGPVVLCTWHGRLACTPLIGGFLDRTITGIISNHADGRIVGAFLEAVGLNILHVKTSGDNSEPVRLAVRHLKGGGTLGLTTDGPMGPPRKSKPGAVLMAALSKAPLVPVGYAASPAIRLKTWDGFLLPMPFGRGVLSVGEGWVPERPRSDEAMQAALERLDGAIEAQMAIAEARLAEKR